MTTRLLMIGDAGVSTGFEKVLRNVGNTLHATGKYDITVRGVGYESKRATIQYPYEIKTTDGTPSDPMGIVNMPKWLAEDKPDVVWTVQDLWNILGFSLFKPQQLPMVAYFPVDTPNMSFGNAWALGSVAEAVVYTKFGAQETAAGSRMALDIVAGRDPEGALEPVTWTENFRMGRPLYGRMDRHARYQNPKSYNIVAHGLDRGMYGPRDKQACRKALNLPESGFIITYVSTNQFRKRQDLALRGFARFLQKHPKSYLVLHCAHDNGQAWDLLQLAYLYGVRDNVILTHKTIGILSDDDLCSLYNAADVNINTSGGEGWGLPIFESAACGIPQIVPDWSATRELWSGYGLCTKVKDYRIEPRQGINTAHAVIDLDHFVQQLEEVLDRDKHAEWSRKALENTAQQPAWGVVGGAFDTIIQNALNEPEARSYSMAQVKALRTGTVQCEIANWI